MTLSTDWAGAVGEVWAAQWTRTDRSFAGLSAYLDSAVLAAAPTKGGRAVDLGCGAGQTSIALATARPDLRVIGVDVAPKLVRIAARRGEHLPNLDTVTADLGAAANRLADGADLLFSRHGVMFFDSPATVFAALRTAVRPGARLVFSCFRAPSLNPWAGDLVEAITGSPPPRVTGYRPGPFAFADAAWLRAMLADAGWRPEPPEPVDYEYVAGEGEKPVADAVDFLRRVGPVSVALRDAAAADRPAMLDRLATALARWSVGGRVSFPAAAWLWSARA